MWLDWTTDSDEEKRGPFASCVRELREDEEALNFSLNS